MEVDPSVAGVKEENNNVENEKGNMELSEELENQIKADYLEEFRSAFYYTKFYGLYDGSAVFLVEADDFGIKEAVIAGVTFSASSQWKIWVWNDGELL